MDGNNNERCLALVFTWAQKAMEEAAIYSQHSGRSMVHVEDITRAMKSQAIMFLHRDDMEQEVLDMEANLDEILGENDEHEPVQEDDAEEEFLESTCTCMVCDRLNRADADFGQWTPNDPAEIFMKDHLSKAIKACKAA